MAASVGVLPDLFDPVRSCQIHACRAALADGRVEQVFLIPAGNAASCQAPEEDRWRMLVSACAGNKALTPVRLSGKGKTDNPEAVLRALRKKVPGSRLILLSAGSEKGALCPSVEEYCALKGLYGAVPRLPGAGPWIDGLFSALNPHRFAHSLAVARTSFQLAVRYGIDPVRAETAGLLHDCAKCLSPSEMRKIARKYHITDDPAVLGSPSLLHSLAGVPVARERYGVEDPDILDAIAFHNTGHAGMSRLAMCVCLADFIEPNREPFPMLEEVRRLSAVSLEKALLLSLECVAAHVRSRGKELHPRTLDTIEWLKTLPAVHSVPDDSGMCSITN